MAVAIPPPHVPFAPGSSYLLDVLVLVPLPFLFLSLASSLYDGLFYLFLGLFVAPQILIVLFLIYLFDNIIQLISLRSLWYYGG
jgi:hypothetical protein